MDKLSVVSRSITAPLCFEHLPHDVLQNVLHYLPIKGARNVFKLLAKGYLASTDYLRIAGLVQSRIRSQAVGESQAQASVRFTGLINDCMDHRLPAGTTNSLIMELINLLPTLPAAALPLATRAVLAASKRLGEKAGREVRQRCIERCVETYQSRSESDAQLPRFEPMDDEEAALAARHFGCSFKPFFATPEQVLRKMENLHAAIAWAGKVADTDERELLLHKLCRHGVTTFAFFNQMDQELRHGGLVQRAQILRTNLANIALQSLPAEAVSGQVALISLALEVSVNDRNAYQLAVSAGRRLLKQTPKSALFADWPTIAKCLFRVGLVQALTERARTWPEAQARAAMLGQIASAAFDKGALKELESLSAMIIELAPPRTAELYEMIKRHAYTHGTARAEVIVRELIPPLIALPAGLEKYVLIAAASAFIFAPNQHAPGLNNQVNMGMLMGLCLESYKKLIASTFGIPVAGDKLARRQLLALADALMEQAIAIRPDSDLDVRATMKSSLIALFGPLAAKIKSQ